MMQGSNNAAFGPYNEKYGHRFSIITYILFLNDANSCVHFSNLKPDFGQFESYARPLEITDRERGLFDMVAEKQRKKEKPDMHIILRNRHEIID